MTADGVDDISVEVTEAHEVTINNKKIK